jgi:hypothetical protein
MAGGESIYESGGVGAQGSCEVGEKCLESEALAELMEGNGMAMPTTTKALLDSVKEMPVQKAAKDMVDAVANLEATGQEGGMFGIPSAQAAQLKSIASQLAGGSMGDGGTLMDSVQAHTDKILGGGDPSKFVENFGQMEQAMAQSADAMHAAKVGATETVSSPIAKVAGQFAPMMEGGPEGGFSGATASANLAKLGEMPLDQNPVDVVDKLITGNAVEAKAAFMAAHGSLDTDSITATQATSFLAGQTSKSSLAEMKTILKTPDAKLASGSDLMDYAKASGGAVEDFSAMTKDFGSDFGQLKTASDMGTVIKPLSATGNTKFPPGTAKVTAETAAKLTSQFGGGSGTNGEKTFKDTMGSVMGKDGPMDAALTTYKDAMGDVSTTVFSDIAAACNGDWSGVTASSDTGGTIAGPGAAGVNLGTDAADQTSLQAVLTKLIPDAQAAAGTASAAMASASSEITSIMEKENATMKDMSLEMSDAAKKVKNQGALQGFASSLSSKMNNPEIKKALGNCLSGATKALADGATFDNALQNQAGVTGTNTLSPRPGPS